MSRRSGFTLVEISIAIAVIGLLAGLGIPSFSAARNKCLNTAKKRNIRLLNNAVELWAFDNLVGDDDPIGEDVVTYFQGGLKGLNIGEQGVHITNITSRTVGYTFTINDLY